MQREAGGHQRVPEKVEELAGVTDAVGASDPEPVDLSYANYGKISPTSCLWFVNVKNGKFNVLNGGKPVSGKLVGDPDLIKQYRNSAGAGVTTTSAAPAT